MQWTCTEGGQKQFIVGGCCFHWPIHISVSLDPVGLNKSCDSFDIAILLLISKLKRQKANLDFLQLKIN